jgi:hypothetical protein
MSDWAKVFDLFERGQISNHDAHELLARIRYAEWERLNAKLIAKEVACIAPLQ